LLPFEAPKESLPSPLGSLLGLTGHRLVAVFPRMLGVFLLEANGAQVQLAAMEHGLTNLTRLGGQKRRLQVEEP
jgi:hypothetical protein